MRSVKRMYRMVLFAVLVAPVFAACASVETLPGSAGYSHTAVLSELVGVWEEISLDPGSGRSKITLIIKSDCTFLAINGTGDRVPGRHWFVDRITSYESDHSNGTMKLLEQNGRWLLILDGKAKNGGRDVKATLTKKT